MNSDSDDSESEPSLPRQRSESCPDLTQVPTSPTPDLITPIHEPTALNHAVHQSSLPIRSLKRAKTESNLTDLSPNYMFSPMPPFNWLGYSSSRYAFTLYDLKLLEFNRNHIVEMVGPVSQSDTHLEHTPPLMSLLQRLLQPYNQRRSESNLASHEKHLRLVYTDLASTMASRQWTPRLARYQDRSIRDLSWRGKFDVCSHTHQLLMQGRYDEVSSKIHNADLPSLLLEHSSFMAKFPSTPHLPSLSNYWELYPVALAHVRGPNGRKRDFQSLIVRNLRDPLYFHDPFGSPMHGEGWLSFFDYYGYHRAVCAHHPSTLSLPSLEHVPQCMRYPLRTSASISASPSSSWNLEDERQENPYYGEWNDVWTDGDSCYYNSD